MRGVWEPTEDGVREIGEISSDGGKTWKAGSILFSTSIALDEGGALWRAQENWGIPAAAKWFDGSAEWRMRLETRGGLLRQSSVVWCEY